MAIWDPTAKFNSLQYFWLYGMHDSNSSSDYRMVSFGFYKCRLFPECLYADNSGVNIFTHWILIPIYPGIQNAVHMKHYCAKPSVHCTSFSSKAEAMQLAVLCMLCMQMH